MTKMTNCFFGNIYYGLVRLSVEELISRLCLLTPEHAVQLPGVRDALAEAIRITVHRHHSLTQTATTHHDKILIQHLLTLASIHPAFTQEQHATFLSCLTNSNNIDSISTNANSSNTNGMDIANCSMKSWSSSSSASTRNSSPISISTNSHINIVDVDNPSSCSQSPSPDLDGDRASTLKEFNRKPLTVTFSAPVVKSQDERFVGAPTAKRQLGAMCSLRLDDEEHNSHRLLARTSTTPTSPMQSYSDLTASSSSGELFHFNPQPGMRDVPIWLKNLRLHKYSNLLSGKSYEELIGVTEEQLENWNVTKGARHKIVMSVQKLRDRPAELLALYDKLTDPASIRITLTELRNMLVTPMKLPVSQTRDWDKFSSIDQIPPHDLPARIAFILKKAASFRLNGNVQLSNEDDYGNLLMQLIDKCMRHEAFYPALKGPLHAIKQALSLRIRPNAFQGHRKLTKSYTTADSHPFVNGNHQSNFENRPLAPAKDFFLSPPTAFPERQPVPQKRALSRMNAQAPPGSIDVSEMSFLKPKTALSRVKSAPPLPSKPLSAAESNLWFDGFDCHLENLVSSMTEHALENYDQSTY